MEFHGFAVNCRGNVYQSDTVILGRSYLSVARAIPRCTAAHEDIGRRKSRSRLWNPAAFCKDRCIGNRSALRTFPSSFRRCRPCFLSVSVSFSQPRKAAFPRSDAASVARVSGVHSALAHVRTRPSRVTHKTAFAANNYVGDFSVAVYAASLRAVALSNPLPLRSPCPTKRTTSSLAFPSRSLFLLLLSFILLSFPLFPRDERTGPAGFESGDPTRPVPFRPGSARPVRSSPWWRVRSPLKGSVPGLVQNRNTA